MTQDTPQRPPCPADDISEQQVREGIELLFFGYRDFTGEPDQILATCGLGRAHHRALYFIGRHPGATVGDLLTILRITKQSLARVLKQLLEGDYVQQQHCAEDGRRRRLFLTAAGQRLERQLFENQCRRVTQAFQAAGPEGVRGFRHVMRALTEEKDRFPE